ncbi:MAG TPA: ABC transporter substrate-binding protein [Kineosporiaceae bacterium]|nr:ABC transporter substrate-binding protein [Kineosporiaceae bacterium]
MSSMKNAFTVTAAGLLAITALTACSDPASEPAAKSTETSSWPAPTTSLAGKSLTIWAAQNSTDIPKPVIAGFEKATGAKVEVVTIPDPYEQNVQTKVATGDKPDLAFWQPTASQLSVLQAKTNLQPMDDAPWLASLDPSVRDITGKLDDTRYAALVSSPSTEGVFYNKEVFAKAGINSTPKNFAEMVADAKIVKEKTGVAPFFEAGGDKWMTQWWVQIQLADVAKDGFWDKVNKNEAKFTDPVVVDAITTYDKLVKDGLFNKDIKTATFEDQGAALLAGKASMVVQVDTYRLQLQTRETDPAALDKKIGFFPISPTGNVATSIPDQSNALVAFKTGDDTRTAAARQFLSYWMGPGYADFVNTAKTVSLEPSVPTPAGVSQLAIDQNKALSSSVGSFQSLAVANPDLYLNLADMLYGKKTPQQVADATQSQFAQLAKAQGVPGF